MRIDFKILVGVFLTSSSPLAHAKDECKDALLYPVLDSLVYNKDSYGSTALMANLDAANAERKKKGIELNVPIENIPVGLRYDSASRLKSTLSQKIKLNEIQKESVSFMLLSGQEAVIKSWRDCMKDREPGFGLRFEPINGSNGTRAFLHVEYLAQLGPGKPTPDNLTLESDVYFEPSVSILGGRNCLLALSITHI